MVALLRYIYGLNYEEYFSHRPDRLEPHAKVYVVVEKYQLQGLKLAVSSIMKRMIDSEIDLGANDAVASIVDFVSALRTVVTGVATDSDHLRRIVVDHNHVVKMRTKICPRLCSSEENNEAVSGVQS